MNNQEIDKLVAEKVMGWYSCTDANGEKWWAPSAEEFPIWLKPQKNFEPSTNIKDAWLVVEKLYEKTEIRMFVSNNFHPFWEARCKKSNGDWIGHGFDEETAPLAICKAALKAIGIEVKKE